MIGGLAGPAQGHFRPRAGAAPLKHSAPNMSLIDLGTYFRPRAGAAPLKPLDFVRRRGRPWGISAPARGRPR